MIALLFPLAAAAGPADAWDCVDVTRPADAYAWYQDQGAVGDEVVDSLAAALRTLNGDECPAEDCATQEGEECVSECCTLSSGLVWCHVTSSLPVGDETHETEHWTVEAEDGEWSSIDLLQERVYLSADPGESDETTWTASWSGSVAANLPPSSEAVVYRADLVLQGMDMSIWSSTTPECDIYGSHALDGELEHVIASINYVTTRVETDHTNGCYEQYEVSLAYLASTYVGLASWESWEIEGQDCADLQDGPDDTGEDSGGGDDTDTGGDTDGDGDKGAGGGCGCGTGGAPAGLWLGAAGLALLGRRRPGARAR